MTNNKSIKEKFFNMEIGNSSCVLAPMDESHTGLIVSWRNKPENIKWFTSGTKLSEESHLKWLEKANLSNKECNWIIYNPDRLPVGAVSIYNIEENYMCAEFGRLIIGNSSDRGKGYASSALKLIIEASHNAGLTMLWLQVISDNFAAINLYKKVGFYLEREDERTSLYRIRLPIG